jgi:hypothetical protein
MRHDDLYLWFLTDPAAPRYVGQLRLVDAGKGVSLQYGDDWLDKGVPLSEDLLLTGIEQLPRWKGTHRLPTPCRNANSSVTRQRRPPPKSCASSKWSTGGGCTSQRVALRKPTLRAWPSASTGSPCLAKDSASTPQTMRPQGAAIGEWLKNESPASSATAPKSIVAGRAPRRAWIEVHSLFKLIKANPVTGLCDASKPRGYEFQRLNALLQWRQCAPLFEDGFGLCQQGALLGGNAGGLCLE